MNRNADNPTAPVNDMNRAGSVLCKNEAKFRLIFESEPECVKLLGPDGTLLEMNPAGLAMIEADSFEQVAGKSLYPIIAEEYLHAFSDLSKRVFAGESGILEFEINGFKGGRRWLETHASPLRDSSGSITSLLGITRDITERKRAKAKLVTSKERLQNIFDGMSVFVGVISTDGRLNEVNHSAAAVGGLPREELIGMYLVDTPWFADLPGSKKQLLRMLQRAAEGSVVREELVIHATDRGQITTDVTFSPLRDSSGNITQIIASGVDVTERKRAEEALAASERKHRDIFTLAPVGIYQCQRDGTLITTNHALAETLGYRSVEELLPVNIADVYLLPGQREELICKYESSGSAIDYELQWKRKDGSPVWVQLNSQAIKGSGGETEYFEGFVLDITDRKRAETYLRESEDRYRQLFDRNLAGVYRSTLDGQTLECNDAFVNMYGYASKQEMLACPASDFYPSPANREQHLAELHEKRELTNYEIEQRRKDGSVMWCIENVALVREADGTESIHGTIIDITSRKLAEQEVRHSREQLAGVIGSAMDAIISIDKSQRIVLFNNAAEKMFLISSAEAIGKPLESFIPERFRSRHREHVKHFGESPVRSRAMGGPGMDELYGLRANGEEFPIETSISRVETDGMNYTVILRDITERKKADEALRESNEKFRQLADNITDVFWIRSLDLRKLYYMSPAYERIFGRSVESIYDDPDKWVDFIHPEDREQIASSFASLTAKETSLDTEYRILRPDGEIRWVRARGFPVRDASNKLIRYAGIVSDITERKELEEQFLQSQKMEAVGQLAGGVAHDFNNLLTAITGYSELALRRLGAADPLRQNIEEIKNAGDRAAALTSQLLAFSRKQVLNPRVHNLNSVIWSIERMLRRIIKESIELRTFLDPDLGNIKADPGQMEQVVMNLAVNARDAMPGGGTLTIETQNCFLEDELASPHVTAQPGKYVRMIVSDSGEGMDEVTVRRIFEPFFTTKAMGKGTGLGLSTVHGIIKQSGGNITVHSKIGVGTTFEVILPRVDEIEQKRMWVGDINENVAGTETILLVEDEEAVRNLARDILKNNGYNVLEAESGMAALSICDTYLKPIHILLTDVVMPKMSGTELRDQFAKLRPDAKILLMSGYTDDLTVHTGTSHSESAFIEKPFTPDGLARKVREVLDA